VCSPVLLVGEGFRAVYRWKDGESRFMTLVGGETKERKICALRGLAG
jgi:hypothetical protein